MSSAPIEPPATIGMLGGGQLGRYALIAARTMGYQTVLLDPDRAAPAGAVADRHLVAAYDDGAALAELGPSCDVVTVEFENPPAESLVALARHTVVRPSAEAVAIAQDRIHEKAFLVGAGFPVGPYGVIEGPAPSITAPFPAILKTARLGYDGRGQRNVADATELAAAWLEFGGVPCVLEQRLQLEGELSVLVARTQAGVHSAYPVAANRHREGILDVSVVPAPIDAVIADQAVALAMAVADALGYVGVLAVELFVVGGALMVNELAPRPHNSAHWTLDVARTSQFEQQIRAICGLPLGDTALIAGGAAMANLLGDSWTDGAPRWAAALAGGAVALHLYGKTEPRPGRKMGHLTAWGGSPEEAESIVCAARSAATVAVTRRG